MVNFTESQISRYIIIERRSESWISELQNEVGKLGVGDSGIRGEAEIGKVGTELLELAIEVGRRGEEFGGEVLGG